MPSGIFSVQSRKMKQYGCQDAYTLSGYQKKEIAKKTGRTVKDIRTDILDDGELNYSAGDDVDQMQEVLEDAVDGLLQENV